MKINHLAIYADDLELLREFYEKYFGFVSGPEYENKSKNFTSYLLGVEGEGARLELMHIPGLAAGCGTDKRLGLTHFSISVGGKEQVDALTERLRADGYTVLSEPRTTGDGFYESAIADPDGNYVEITV